MIFRNGRLVFPDGIRDGLELVVHEGRISEIRKQNGRDDDEVIDLKGNLLAPGFIDLHLHGAAGRDTMEATPDAFRTIRNHHASGGTTSLLLTTVTAPIPEIVRVLEAVRQLNGTLPEILGVHVEGPFIASSKCGAQRAEFIIEPAPDSTAELLRFADIIKLMTLAPEIPGVLHLIDRLR